MWVLAYNRGMKLQSPFSALATTGVDALALQVLARADAVFSVTEVHQLAPEKCSRESIRLSLIRLEQSGLVTEHRIGYAIGYALNREHLLADAVLEIVSAKQRLLAKMQAEAESWVPQAVAVWLFGSAARGEMHLDSDIDILVVTTGPVEQLNEQIRGLCKQVSQWTGNDCKPLVYEASEVVDAPIFQQILADGTCLAGEVDWLRRAINGTPPVPESDF